MEMLLRNSRGFVRPFDSGNWTGRICWRFGLARRVL